jgi:hypothetical protein
MKRGAESHGSDHVGKQQEEQMAFQKQRSKIDNSA